MRESQTAISIYSTICTVAVVLLCSCSPEMGSSRAESLRISKGPYLQNVTQEGITIMWESSHPAVGSVLYGVGGELDKLAATESRARIHELHLTGLSAATEYSYQVELDGRSSDVHTFTTAVTDDSPFRFATYGDNKDGPAMHERVADAILAKRPAFVIHNGDLVNTGYVAKQWGLLFFGPARRLMHSVPLYPVLGNHEERAQLFFDYFSLPGNEAWYSFDYGNAHFVVLESPNEDQMVIDSEQIRWLRDDLANSTATWKFANFHHPPFSSGGFYHASDRIALKKLLHPIFEQYEIDFVFSGHDHNYERMLPIGSDHSEHKVSYVIAGNGGTPLRWVGAREWTVHAQRVFGFVTVDIEGTSLHLQSHTLDGEVIDELLPDKADRAAYGEYLDSALDFDAIEDPIAASDHYETGDDFSDEDLYEEALVEFLAGYAADPTCIEAVGEIADTMLELGRTDEAIEWALRGIEILPQFTGTYEVLVEAHHELGDDQAAFAWASRLEAIAPDSTGAQEAIAEIYVDRGELDAAIDALERALAILPSDAEIHFDLGRLYERKGDDETALVSYARGLYWFMEEDGQDEEDLREYREIRRKVMEATKL
jgi:tetratricopeptide (TPR) repeat protein